jgi:copper homeostasis protein
MIRPRGGNFVYTDAELTRMKEEITSAKAEGADGVVFGMLRSDGHVETRQLRELVALARPLAVTFHRAFDETADPLHALDEIIAAGADILLTSGQRPTALEGAALIAELERASRGRVVIMPGAGIHRGNAAELRRRTGVRTLHAGTAVHDRTTGRVSPALVREFLDQARK